MTRFGDFKPLCSDTPSYTWCNLFYRQLQRIQNGTTPLLQDLSNNSVTAPVGINPTCGIERAGQNGSLGNIANIILCGLSVFVVIGLIVLVSRRKAAVGRVEFRFFLILYLLTLPFQLLTTGSLLEQGSTALVALTAIHAGLVATLFWSLLSNALVSTQVVEDGTISSILPFTIFAIAFFAGTTYISFDVALGVTRTIGTPNGDPLDLHSVPLFVLTSIWPGGAAILYFLLITYIVLAVLREVKPMLYYAMAAALFVLSQLAWFLLGRVMCSVSRSGCALICYVLVSISYPSKRFVPSVPPLYTA
ncbi:hypothetical protein E1B28_008727 [Marasmius oreades]|uniref:Chitin synthase export chaperone n=1 Tax=Marasmius oreades TaxID=181124 RepID=A0A9P7S0K5_9AGAR|nr:uncharacterized protein E1B28_008727 [Marasmius oreades]KAG7092368.1 hypothetical protein E1B28_008727 [Marasmius oreades]